MNAARGCRRRWMAFGAAAGLSFACWAQLPSGERAKPSPAQLAGPPFSPEVHRDRSVTFRVYAPKASEVMLVGGSLQDALGRPLALRKDEKVGLASYTVGQRTYSVGTVWSATVGPLEPDIYDYGFSIDGNIRAADPASPYLETLRWGTISYVEVPGDRPMFYDLRPVPHGTVHRHWYESKATRSFRRLHVYTPPGYESAVRAQYPVLFLLHGSAQNETSWVESGRADLILDNLLAEAKTVPMIVVMPYGHRDRSMTAAEMESEGRIPFEEFEQDLLGDVLPFVEDRYRVYRDAPHRAIAGLSMGAVQSTLAGLKHLDLFSHVGAFSGGIGRAAFEQTFAGLLADPAGTNRKLKLYWIGRGRQEGGGTIEPFSDFLRRHGINHVAHTGEFGHTWRTWRRDFLEFVPLLFRDAAATASR